MLNISFKFAIILLFFSVFHLHGKEYKIDRFSLVNRNNISIKKPDILSSLSVGNGNFAFTTDITGLQTFEQEYKNGIPLGTQSQWGWHSFPNPNNYKFEETLFPYNFRGKTELYSIQPKEKGRQYDAVSWYRANPHRLHLGIVGFEIKNSNGNLITLSEIKNPFQKLNLWKGEILSNFYVENSKVEVQTVCDPDNDGIATSFKSRLASTRNIGVKFHFPYATGIFADDACDWNSNEKHKTTVVKKTNQSVILKRTIDETEYFITISWIGKADFIEKETNYFVLQPSNESFSFTCNFTQQNDGLKTTTFTDVQNRSVNHWKKFWKRGGVIDFSQCKDNRAKELERRVILSQYLMAIQCAGNVPPQESGLTYNTWYGKFHLEMHWWHAVHFALWGRSDLMEKSLEWYTKAYPIAKSIAERQNFKGVRWMKMTDPSAIEAPSSVGSFLIWQQPHFIYMADLAYRSNPSTEVINKYKDLVFATADFMASFADYDAEKDRYVLKGVIPAQETLRASETTNPPFELSYWHYALQVAQKWREKAGLSPNMEWQQVIDKLSRLASKDGLYLAAETAPETYQDVRFTSDHMAVLGAFGVLPKCNLFDAEIMKNTFNWIWENWNWDKTWGWDFPMTAMSAARLGMPEKAVDALLIDKKTNTYLANGHNYQDDRLRLYLPGNGGLLTAVSMMCTGWDGCKEKNPGFPNNGNWDVKWEGLQRMP